MTIVHSQVIRTVKQGDPAKDFCVNNVYHDISDPFPLTGPDYQNHANQVLAVFAGTDPTHFQFQLYANSGITVKVYDNDEAKPRLPKAQATYTPTNWASYAMGPRDVQCCLSYYHQNPSIKSERGRIYIGPWPAARLSEHVDPLDMNMLLDLGHGLFDIGGENVAHVVHSPTHNTNAVVAHYWCNNQWDTIRSRDVKETSRVLLSP